MAEADRISSLKNLLILILVCFFASCDNIISNDWTQFVPDETAFILVPERDATIKSVLSSKYLPLLDDVTSSSIQLIHKIDSTAANAIQLRSILLYPGADQKLQPIWIAKIPADFFDNMESTFEDLYGQEYYYFKNIPILKISTNSNLFFATRINDFLLLSESSLGIENAIRAYRGDQPAALLDDIAYTPGTIIMNTPALDSWTTQQTKVSFYPAIQQTFNGTLPTALTITTQDSLLGGLKLEGQFSVDHDAAGTLVNAVTSQNAAISLGKYISFDAAAYALLRLPPLSEFPKTIADTTSADSFFISHKDIYQKIGQTLGNEFAMVMFAKSGFRSINEHAFIRKIAQPEQLMALLSDLSKKNVIKKVEDTYFVRSASLCRLVGSKLCNLPNFYFQIVDDALLIAERRGLVELMASDYQRRQVIIYEPFFKKIAADLPDEVSGLVVGGKNLFLYLKPFLKQTSYVGSLTSLGDYIVLSTQKKESKIDITITAYNVKTEEKPFVENWVFKTNSTLTGAPVFANIRGSESKEIIFATADGKVQVLGADGTLIQTYSTGGEKPIGAAISYDWYNNGQPVVMVAAGNQIFAWSLNGDLLPQFPFTLDETITTPLTVTDIDSNGLADIIVATADRKLHLLNARGDALFGWPVRTNAIIKSKPLITRYRNQLAIAAFASNAVHIWQVSGRPFTGFPYFVNASFTGQPVQFNGEILGAATNGILYAFGDNDLFDNSLNSTDNDYYGNGNIEMLSVSNEPLYNAPFTLSNSTIAVMNVNGTVYLYDESGKLLLAKSMGQSPAKNWQPVLIDINNDGQLEVAVLADYGRLYAWNIKTGERIQQLPTAAIQHVTIGDIDDDGRIEIVGQTEAGIHSWTVN